MTLHVSISIRILNQNNSFLVQYTVFLITIADNFALLIVITHADPSRVIGLLKNIFINFVSRVSKDDVRYVNILCRDQLFGFTEPLGFDSLSEALDAYNTSPAGSGNTLNTPLVKPIVCMHMCISIYVTFKKRQCKLTNRKVLTCKFRLTSKHLWHICTYIQVLSEHEITAYYCSFYRNIPMD